VHLKIPVYIGRNAWSPLIQSYKIIFGSIVFGRFLDSLENEEDKLLD
jgi:hypothetical protein